MFKKLISMSFVLLFLTVSFTITAEAHAGTLAAVPVEQLHDSYAQITGTTDIQAKANTAGYPYYMAAPVGSLCTVDRKFYTVVWFTQGMFARGQIEYWTQHCNA